MNAPEPDRDYETYRQLLRLWAQENPIKTHKLQVFLLTQAVLVAAVVLNGGLVAGNALLFLAGVLVSLVWTWSLGRTALYQEIWQIKLQELAGNHPEDPRFALLKTAVAKRRAPRWLRILGGVSARYYLVGAPLLFTLAWLLLLCAQLVC